MTTLRPATADDLAEINHVIDAAVMSWNLPERVKRLSLPSYHYSVTDLDHLAIRVAETGDEIAGVSATEPAEAGVGPEDSRTMLLHGLYVFPACSRQGIGITLLCQPAGTGTKG